jgi:signal peptidase I
MVVTMAQTGYSVAMRHMMWRTTAMRVSAILRRIWNSESLNWETYVGTQKEKAAVTGKDKKKAKEQKGGVLKTVFYAVAIAIVVRTFLFEPFNIPSGSMYPGLYEGDYLFVSKYSYGYSKYSLPFSPDILSGRILASKPKRGDVAVFRFPPDPSVDYIKRVIGLPGDRIKLTNGRLYLNGAMVKRSAPLKRDDLKDKKVRGYDASLGRECPTPQGTVKPATKYRETLPTGRSYVIWECSDQGRDSDNFRETKIPAGHYFMMGDNRDNSNDSRFDVGPVPFVNFIGRAEFLFFSVNGLARIWEVWKWPSAIRFGRIFKGIR